MNYAESVRAHHAQKNGLGTPARRCGTCLLLAVGMVPDMQEPVPVEMPKQLDCLVPIGARVEGAGGFHWKMRLGASSGRSRCSVALEREP